MTSDPLIRLIPFDHLESQIAAFVDDCRLANLSPRTVSYYEDNLRRFHWWCAEFDVPLDPELHSANTLREFLRYVQSSSARWGNDHSMSVRPVKASTHDTYYRVLRRFYNWLVEQEFIDKSPMEKIRRPKVREEQPDPFSDDELHRLADALKAAGDGMLADRDRAIIAVLLDSGIRVSELCGIQAEDINVATGDLYITYGKGNKPRQLRLGARARRATRRYVLRHRRQYGETGPFFLSVELEPLTRNAVRFLLLRLGKRAGVENIHPHRFRHTMAINAIRAGMPLFQLQAILGHTSLDMVKRYAKIADQDIIKASQDHSPLDHLKLPL